MPRLKRAIKTHFLKANYGHGRESRCRNFRKFHPSGARIEASGSGRATLALGFVLGGVDRRAASLKWRGTGDSVRSYPRAKKALRPLNRGFAGA
jgi:hypothetical protein